jgi:hypothetical protein
MALGFNYSIGGGDNGDIVPFVKYDARAGRFFRNDRSETNGAYSNNAVDITNNFKAVMDLENLEVGYLLFAAGAAPQFLLVKLGDPMPQKPADAKWKQGVRVMMKLRPIAAATSARRRATPRPSSRASTNCIRLRSRQGCQPRQAADRGPENHDADHVRLRRQEVDQLPARLRNLRLGAAPVDLVHVAKGSSHRNQSPTTASPASAPSTGSTQVGAPAAKQPSPMAAEDFG